MSLSDITLLHENKLNLMLLLVPIPGNVLQSVECCFFCKENIWDKVFKNGPSKICGRHQKT